MRRMQHGNPMDDSRKGRHPAPAFLVLLIFMMLAGTGFWIRDRLFAPAPDPAGVIAEPGSRVMLDGKILETALRPLWRDGQVWLRMETILEHIDPYAWFDPNGEQITFTTDDRVIRMRAGSREALDGHLPLKLAAEPVLEGGTVWLPADFLAGFYDLEIRPMIFNGNVRLDRKTSATDVLFQHDGSFQASKPGKAMPEPGAAPSWKPARGKLSLAWEMMYAPNSRYLDRKPSSGLDVLAPTWFSVSGAEDAIAVRADKEYIRWAHGSGYKVWALFANQFDDIAGTSKLMRDPERRQAVIESILGHAKRFGLDGINLDFENMYREDIGYYTQFVREFAAVLRPEGLVLSVDVSVPGGSDTWSLCFDRKALAESADFIFLMAYDQHYAGSREACSTAEIG